MISHTHIYIYIYIYIYICIPSFVIFDMNSKDYILGARTICEFCTYTITHLIPMERIPEFCLFALFQFLNENISNIVFLSYYYYYYYYYLLKCTFSERIRKQIKSIQETYYIEINF